MKTIASLSEIGVPSHLKGYKYILRAVTLVKEDNTYLDNVVKGIYFEVAKTFNTTPSRVERAIRHAVETAFNNLSPCEIYEFFGNSIPKDSGRPTNAHFISTVAQILEV